MKNIPAKPKKKNSQFWFFSAISFVIFFWSIVVHPFEFPDEQAHMGSVEFLRREGRMPMGEEKDMTEEMKLSQEYLSVYRNPQGQNKYTYHPEYHVEYSSGTVGILEPDILSLNRLDLQDEYVATEAARYPPLYYSLTNLISQPVQNSDLLTRLYTMRLGGVILAFFMAYYVYRLGLLIFGKAVYARTLTLMVMLQPMVSFVTAGVNSDNLHNLLFNIVIYYGLSIVKYGVNINNGSGIFFGAVLDIFSKPQGIITLPIIFISLFIFCLKNKNYYFLIGTCLLIILIMIIGWSEISIYIGLLFRQNTTGSSFTEFFKFSVNKLIAQNIVWFWGVYKWLGVVLPPIYWQVANRVVLLSVLGFAAYFYKAIKGEKVIVIPLTSLFLVFTNAIYFLAIYWYDWQTLKIIGYSIGVQARYFYPVIAPMMALMLVGLMSLVSKLRHRRFIRYFVIALFLSLQLGGLSTLVKSYYDVSSLEILVRQLSQYKPWWGKGNWWYLWGSLYFTSLLFITSQAVKKLKK